MNALVDMASKYSRRFARLKSRFFADTPVVCEQSVYGSFAFWDRGYDVLAKSPGCRSEWVAEWVAACRSLGEQPRGKARRGFFAQRLRCGVWIFVGVFPAGCDDQGRPGALVFHALFASDRDFRGLGADPFLFEPLLRGDWDGATTSLAPALLFCNRAATSVVKTSIGVRARRIADAVARGAKVVVEADAAIDELARHVWRALPKRARARKTLATWSATVGAFDLIAMPRLPSDGLRRPWVAESELPLKTASTAIRKGAVGVRRRIVKGARFASLFARASARMLWSAFAASRRRV